ncbi:unnamed protein product [Rangifer tarandus platyrhynchus]|uniref:Uncharacterized protein n=1 Tax=Rangifer tarandus platyrhynchus TaxID=3082113 RepID=A0ABN8YET9_RANTA|nr:unnamed protein product [Rangifer tarandus platyrhynchus]
MWSVCASVRVWVEIRAGSCLYPHPQGPPYPRGGAAFPSQGAPRAQSCPVAAGRGAGRGDPPGFGAEPPGGCLAVDARQGPRLRRQVCLCAHLQRLDLPKRRAGASRGPVLQAAWAREGRRRSLVMMCLAGIFWEGGSGRR